MSFQILQRAYAPYGTAAQFPASGDSRLIYRATDTGYLYTWDASESAYKLAGIDPATAPYLGLHAQADDAARLGGQLPSYYAQAGHVHNYAGSSTPGGAATYAGLLEPISGQAGYKLGYAADGARIHPGSWGRVVMRYDANGETYGVRVDQADMVSDPGYCRIAYPGGGVSVAQISQPVGAIAIRLPVGMTNTMARITVKVYEFLSGSSFECHVSGYNCTQDNTWVNSPTAYIVGNPNVSRQLTVRLGYDSALDKAIIYIGELNSVWAYPQIYVTEVLCGYSGYGEVWASGWQIGFESSAFKNVTATITDCQVGYKIPNPSADGYLLSSTAGGVRSWVAPYSHPATHAQSVIDSSSGWITTALANKQAAGSYLTTTGTAADSAKLGGVAASGYSQTSHTHNYAGSSAPGGAATTALACTGNAATATALATARLINGASFNGSSDVIVSKIYDANYARIVNPDGGTLLTNSTKTGAIAIRLPNGFSNTMLSFSGFVYNYLDNKSFTFSVHGYCYSGDCSWHCTSAQVSGFPETNLGSTVRFGRLADLSPVDYIGELDSAWTYPQVSVNNVFCAWDGFSSVWTTGWQITFESNAFLNVSAVATNCQVGYRPANAFTGAKVIGGTTYNFVNGLLVS